MNKKNLILYTILTIAASWLIWIPLVLQNRGMLHTLPDLSALKIIGALMPAVMGLIMAAKEGGKKKVGQMIKSSFTKIVSLKWMLIVCISPFVINLAALLIFKIFETNLPQSEMVVNIASFFSFTLAVFFVGGGLDEEIGWRGYLTDGLLKLTRPIHAIWITSIIWTVWHLPLFYIAGTNQAQLGFFEFALPVIALTVIVTWIYFCTRSILLCALFHTFGNVAHEVFRIVPTDQAGNPLGFYIFTGIMIMIAAIILLLDMRLYKRNDIMVKNGR